MSMDIEKAKALFPEALRDQLLFEEQAGYIVIKPRQFLSSENFAEIIRVVKEAKGEYITAGKDSHFRIPLLQPRPQEEQKQAPSLHFKVTKLTVGLGTTVQHGETEWVKQSYELEVEVNSDSVDVVERARLEAEQIVNQWLKEPPLSTTEVPHIDIAELAKLPWKSYQTKEAAKPGEAAWIFANVQGVEELAKALKKSSGEKLILGDQEYSFSGKEKQFISRKPAKSKE
jgi:hypothetical protein